MLINDLPKRYQKLAKKYTTEDSGSLMEEFPWHLTKEGVDFWHACHRAQNPAQLPRINKMIYTYEND